MRIIFANGRNTYPLIRGGDGVSLHYFLSRLAKDRHTVLSIGKSDPAALNRSEAETSAELSRLGITHARENGIITYQLDASYESRMIEGCRFLSALKPLFETFRPDIVLTQLEHSASVISTAAQCSIPCLCFIHDTDPENEQTLDLGDLCAHVVFNSDYCYSRFRDRLRTQGTVIFPPIDRATYYSDGATGDCITFINPIPSKGSKIVEALVRVLASQSFLIVPGWQPVDQIWRSFPNVTIASRTLDMRSVYARTRILLVPSQCPEAFGRVAAEAACCSIPSIASNVGGLPAAVGDSGVLITDYSSVDEWAVALEELLEDPERRKRLGLLALEHSKNFAADAQYQKLYKILENLRE